MSNEEQQRDRAIIQVAGSLVSGLGQGQYYLSLPLYCSQIEEKLGFFPFPGTLNLKVPQKEHDFLRELARNQGLLLEGTDEQNPEKRLFRVFALPCKLEDTPGALLFPEKSAHLDILELVAPACLRETLGLSDGDVVSFRV